MNVSGAIAIFGASSGSMDAEYYEAAYETGALIAKSGKALLFGGGDTGIMIDLVKYFGGEEPSKSICGINTSFMNHLIAFAAEESRLGGKVVDLDEFAEEV